MNYIATHNTQPPQILSEAMARQMLGSDPAALAPGESASNGDWTITRPASDGSVAPAAFSLLWYEAVQAESRQLYLAQWSVARVVSGSDLPLIQEYLGRIWDVAHMTMRDICKEAHLTQKAVSTMFCIPHRTFQGWCLGERECPHYVRLMIARLLNLL